MNLSIAEITEGCGGKLLCGDPRKKALRVCINSREVRKDDLFVPIRGERVDAHRFLMQALSNGASVSFTEEHESREELLSDPRFEGASLPEGAAVIAVGSTVGALQKLAAWYRKRFVHIPVIGVTGSVGKTTTREMIACALSAEKKVYKTPGNANSQISLPITVLGLNDEWDIAVIELGMSEPGEMTRIANCACVDAAVMTNIGVSHIAQLGSQRNILNEKLHILDGCSDGAALILNREAPLLSEVDAAYLEKILDLSGKKIRILFYGGEEDESKAPELLVPGDHMRLNALAALKAAELFGVDRGKASECLSAFTGVEGRSASFRAGGVTVYDSSYNAAPDSMRAELKVLLVDRKAERRIAVLADMKELGPDEVRFHREIGAFLAAEGSKLDELWLYGTLAEEIGKSYKKLGGNAPVHAFAEFAKLKAALLPALREGDAVLFKGSHSMGLSEAVRAVREDRKNR